MAKTAPYLQIKISQQQNT